VIIATGSEVALAMAAQKALAEQGIARARRVDAVAPTSSTGRTPAYRLAVLPRGMPRVAVEAGVTDFWRKYVGLEGAVVGIDRFGESGPAGEVFEYFGITADRRATGAGQDQPF
jgi:transketolase